MKNWVAIITIAAFLGGTLPASAQNSQDQDDDYGQYSQPGPGGYSQQGPPPPPPGYSQQGPGAPGANSGPEQNTDQPAPGMARLSFMQGQVSTQRGDNAEWVGATLNSPIAVGDRVSTGDNSRAELQLDFADVLRLSSDTTVKIATLERGGIQVQVGKGLATYSELKGGEATPEIDTPNASIHPNGPGQYRILVNSDGETEVVIRDGSAEVSEPSGSTHVDRGQMITIEGTDNPQYKVDAAPAQDAWDTWTTDRDRKIESASSWHKTDRYYTGSEDLDQYGVWSEVPDYGQVWTPNEGPGWTPYSDGRWVYEPYYGWTWVGYEPWGWAPYHYGRWMVYGGNWVWWPGPVAVYPAYYPVWSPAYVSFFGWGGLGFGISFGFGFGFGHIGWLPCGPGDWYHPWWGRWGGGFAAHAGFAGGFHDGFGPLGPRGEHSFSNIREAETNARVRSGITSMDSNRFGREAVNGHGTAMSGAQFRQASFASGRLPSQTSRESFSPTGRAGSESAFRDAPANSQHFFTSARNNTVARSASSRPAAGLDNSSRGSFSNESRTNGSFENRSNGSFSNQNRSTVQSSRPGWHSFTPPSSQSQASRGYQQRGESQRGFNSSASASRGYSNSYNSYSRPPLNMRQPVVTPRGGSNSAYGNSRGYSGAYGQSRGSYGESRGAYSTPRGSYSAPRSSGGGHYSAPRSSGGGHSGGGHSGGGHGGKR